MEVNTEFELELKLSLIKSMEKWYNDNQELVEKLEMYWGANTIARMAGAAMIVLMASKEAQEISQENE